MPMTTVLEEPPVIDTVADLMEQLGGISPARVRIRPPLGTATEADVIAVREREGLICELVDGVLVEKPMGYSESVMACALIEILRRFVRPRNQGLVSGPDGTMRLFPGLVRIPDVAFASWDRIPGGQMPKVPIPDLAPDLAVEVLSESNTEQEMARKRREYFAAGVRLVWMIDPRSRTATVFTGPEQSSVLDESQTLDGGEVLPGFLLPLRELFAELDLRAGDEP
jgi:Uma2 family endonuclease